MSYRNEQNPITGQLEIVIDGWEKGIESSPYKGLAFIKNANISTENGEVLCSYGRVKESQSPVVSGTLTFLDTSTVSYSGGALRQGSWITVGVGITGLTTGVYYVLETTGGSSSSGNAVLSATFSASDSSKVTGMSAGSATYNTNLFNMALPVAYCIEPYTDINGAQQYRYYVLDQSGLVWVHDSYPIPYGTLPTTPLWFLPSTQKVTTFAAGNTISSGIAVLNGWLFVFSGNKIVCKPTVNLGDGWKSFGGGSMLGMLGNLNPHFAFVGHQGKLYYTDGNYLGSIFPNSSIGTTAAIPNIQSFFSYTAVTDTGTITNIISGSTPTTALVASTARIPMYPFASTGGTVASSLTSGGKYYVQYTLSTNTFQVFSVATAGSAIADLTTGATGTQYFNTFSPDGGAGAGADSIVFTPQNLNLPTFETAQCIGEIGNTVLIGTKSNTVYPWNQIDPLPSDLIFLPENNVTQIITVNNMGYLFAGNKGNIYITNGSAASLVISVPDYCAGRAGTALTFIEPYFTWGGAMYLRGRVYFSILDQTATKTGNCGGVWSFVPIQNMYIGQDTGIALRLENQNSYGTYNGVATLLIPNQNQAAISPQYWSAWYSSISNPLYGIDNTDTVPGTAVIECDLIPTGSFMQKVTFSQIEYKLSAPLVSGDSVSIAYRLNSNGAFVDLGSAVVESITGLSGYFTAQFELTQWLQLQITLTSNGSSSSSFCRLINARIK